MHFLKLIYYRSFVKIHCWSNSFVFRFEAAKRKEVENLESSLWFNMIENFMKSKCKSLFTLRLLVNALYLGIEVPEKEITETTSRKERNEKKLILIDNRLNKVQKEIKFYSEEEVENKIEDYFRRKYAEKENISNNCILTGSSSSVENHNLKMEPEYVTKLVNKIKFFGSSTENSESDQESEVEVKLIEKNNTYKLNSLDSCLNSTKFTEINEVKHSTNKKTFSSDEKLNKTSESSDVNELLNLLRLSSNSLKPNTESEKSNSSKTKENVQNKSGNKKPDEKEDNLLDFFNTENVSATEEILEKDNASFNENFEALINEHTKKTFLLSSSEESLQEMAPFENLSQKSKKKCKKKKKATRKRSSLESYGISFTLKRSDSEVDDKEFEEVSECDSEKEDRKSDEGSDGPDEFILKETQERTSSQSVFLESDQNIVQKVVSPIKGRKNINKILKKDFLEVGTKQARKMEAERKKRLAERKKVFEKLFCSQESTELVLDYDTRTKEKLVVVDDELSKVLKPHQREGIRFMWDNCFESIKKLEENNGSGCILAHCMGLGKTLQVVTLIHTLFNHDTGVKSVMILCPLSLTRNWEEEFKFWLKNCKNNITTFEVTSCNILEKKITINKWAEQGGVLIISYDTLRSLLSVSKVKVDSLISALIDPDLVVCDEGHLLKNEKTALSKCLAQMKTHRRIVLTGTPLQNNLLEYFCMVQFVKPNILGTKKEFMNGFVNPIQNGQFEDSTDSDVRLMKRRAHVLHVLVEGFVQRLGYEVLVPFLPEKQEYVISIALTVSQDKLYRALVEKFYTEPNKLFKDFHWLQKAWTHPWVLLKSWEKNHLEKRLSSEQMKEYWSQYFKEEEYNDIHSGRKLLLLFQILKSCKRIGDKILVFTQYLETIDLIEYFLYLANKDFQNNCQSEFADSWVLGTDYFRIDGSRNSDKRFECCKMFNNTKNERARLFLISTRAGGLGINLIAANRVVLFDVSWNPSNDVQSIFRVYRFGQTKPCYIYRFLAEATIEEKIYQRQVTKLSLAHRIIDEHQIERHFSMMNLQELYKYEPKPKKDWTVPKIPKDNIFAEILAVNKDIIIGYHEHDSLLENIEEEELSEEERRAAWEDFEKERVIPVPTKILHTGNIIPQPQSLFLDSGMNEALKTVLSYKKLIMPKFDPKISSNNQSQNEVCKIVDVRTFQGLVPNTVVEEQHLPFQRELPEETPYYLLPL